MEPGTINRDEKGRVLAEDGHPLSGLATINEGVVVSGLSRSKIYEMVRTGELESRRFGKSRRITWASIRKAFLSSEVAQ